MPAVVDKAAWKKVTKEQVSIRWDKEAEKVWEEGKGNPKKGN